MINNEERILETRVGREQINVTSIILLLASRAAFLQSRQPDMLPHAVKAVSAMQRSFEGKLSPVLNGAPNSLLNEDEGESLEE